MNRSILLTALSLSALSVFSHAQTSDEDVAELSTINVSGSELKGPQISTEKLLKVPGAGNDPLKAVEALPGVVLGGFGPFSVPAVRGSSPNDNIYITDFLPVGYVFHNDGGSTYNDNIIEDFSLKAGAWGPEYSNAIGAVLATKLRDPYQEPIRTTLDLSFLRAGGLVEGAVSDDSAFYFSYRRSLLEFYVENFVDEDELTFTEVPKNSDYQFKYQWRMSPVSNLRFIATGANDSVGIDFGPESDDLAREPALAGGLDADTYYHNQGIVFDTVLDGGTATILSLSRKEEDVSFSVGTLFELDAINYEYRLKNYYFTPLNNGDTFRYGFDLSNTEIEYTASGLYSPCNDEVGDECPPASLGEVFDNEDSLTINGLYTFVAYDWLATPDLEVTLGLGNSYNDFNEEQLLQPRISSRYSLNDSWTLTAAVGRHSQFIREFRFIAKELGNPDLKQPIANHYVVGFEHQIDDSLSTKLEVYYKDIDNLVAANTKNTTPPYLNNANGTAYGLELLINKNLTDKWYGWLSVAYSKTKRENEDSGLEIDYELDRPWIVNLVANYQKNEKTSYGFKWRYQSGSLVTPITGATPFYSCGLDGNGNPQYSSTIEAGCNSDPYIYDPIEGKPNSQRLSAYHRLDFRIDHDLSGRSTLYFEIINLYNRANVSDISYNKDYTEAEDVTSLPTIFSVGTKLVF
ncbi:TonB-dependent receptor plug domain-containing protein [Bermanella sp. WJH001]|uniref:TonB-dependent receptor plug domain-containing protein n=1 Tax=Bermanella sp. WJH001 TaxID=3048005 RepID=UPI0024BDAAE1|nr:TonB-dependent receptor [Bermanella sp. WJH001]MDJ1538362.1 TonB-dependent receptor [Bermanella sp. WJH001]